MSTLISKVGTADVIVGLLVQVGKYTLLWGCTTGYYSVTHRLFHRMRFWWNPEYVLRLLGWCTQQCELKVG